MWEDGELLSSKAQWALFYGATPGSRPWCKLDQIVIRPDVTHSHGPLALSPATFSTPAGNLRIRRADLKAGALDLQLLRPEGPTTEVELRFTATWWGDALEDAATLSLDSLRAVEVFRQSSGNLLTREYRLTEYNSVATVSFYLAGRFPHQRREWEAVLGQFARADRAKWQALIAEPGHRPERNVDLLGELLKDEIPDWKEVAEGRRQPTPEEEPAADRARSELTRRELKEWLAASGLSPQVQALVLEFREKQMRDGH